MLRIFSPEKSDGFGRERGGVLVIPKDRLENWSRVAKARFLSFNRIQLRAVTGLLTGHNTMRRHLYLMGLSDSPLCRRCEAEDETSANILCECEALASFQHMHLGSLFLESEDIMSIMLGDIWTYGKVTGFPWIDLGQKEPIKIMPSGREPNCNKSTNQSIIMISPGKLANQTCTASNVRMNLANKTSIGSKQAKQNHFCLNSCRV
jgi:hypothetical protein